MSIEQNLERIAIALETIVGSMQPHTAPIRQTVADGPANAQPPTPVQAPTAPTPAGVWPDYSKNPAPINTAPVLPPAQQAPVQAAMPAPAVLPAQPVQATQVPVTASPQQFSFDQLAVATANLAATGKDVFPILGRFGVSMLMDLPQERFGEYAAALREAGAVI